MINLIENEFWIVRFFSYSWAFYELGNLAALYIMAHKADKDEFITSLMIISAAMLSVVGVLMILSIVSHFLPPMRESLTNIMILPIATLAFSVHGLRNKYKKNGFVKHNSK